MSGFALNRREAAEFVGVSPTTFDKLVEKGHMPKPRQYPETRRLVSELEPMMRRILVSRGVNPGLLDWTTWRRKALDPAQERLFGMTQEMLDAL